jgi:hypothetical protein
VPVYGRYIAASNRAYTAFLNTVRAHAFTNIAEGLKAEGRDIATDTVLGKELGKMINTTTGRSPLKLDIPFTGKLGFGKRLEADFERSADVLNFAMFSPRNYMTNVRMLNPWTYSNAPAGVRQQYVYAMLRKVGAWSSMLFLGNMIGGKTNYDPNNADFMKLHFPGGTRIDPGGGLQQFMVLAHRLLPEALGGGGISSSAEGPNYGKFMPFGYGYKPETRKTTTINFMVSHAHPTVGLAAQAADATQYRPFYPVDEAIKRIVPMFSSDVMDVVNQHPDLGSIVKGIATGFASSIGMGAQTYEKGSNPSFTKLPIIGKAAEYRIPPPGHRF